MIRISIALALVTLTAPASAQEAQDPGFRSETILALKSLQLLDQRLNAIGYRLVAANAPFCAEKTAQSGLALHDIGQYGDPAVARFALGFDGTVAVNAVAAGSPGSAAGLLPGDDILAISGVAVESLPQDDADFAKEPPEYRRIAAVNLELEKALAQGEVVLDILRGGETHQVSLQPQSACPSRFQIAVEKDRGASADGTIVSVSSTLAEYFQNDDEFAAVVAHELAHNLLHHRERLDAQKVNRGFFGQFGKSAGQIKDTEIEADRLSVWLMANAGFDPQAAIRFWTRYGKQHGKGIFSASTHYRWKKRVTLFAEELAKMAVIEPVGGKWSPPLLTGTD